MRKNFRLNELEARDLEVINFLEGARNESELIKNALIFYKKAIEKNVIFDTNINNEDMWDKIFETAVPLQLIKEDRERVKEKLIKQKKKEEKLRMKELTALTIKSDKVDSPDKELEVEASQIETEEVDSPDNDETEMIVKFDSFDSVPLSFDDVIEDSGDM